MKQYVKLILLYSLLACIFIVIANCIASLLMTPSARPTLEEEGYDYEGIQAMVIQDIVSSEEDAAPVPPVYDAEALLKENADFRGWLQIPNTTVSYPVVQGIDNAYYLKHSFKGYESVFGCLFLDFETQDGDYNRVIHGHNMGTNRTEMFSSLVDFQDPAYVAEHETLFFSEPDRPGEETYQIFAVLNFNVNNLDSFNYLQQQFDSDEAFADFVSYLKNHSMYQSDYTPNGSTIILSTCNRVYGEDNRLLICAGRDVLDSGE